MLLHQRKTQRHFPGCHRHSGRGAHLYHVPHHPHLQRGVPQIRRPQRQRAGKRLGHPGGQGLCAGELRKQKGIKQEDLAAALEVSRQTIGSLENGRYNPSILLAFKIARYFNMYIEDIFIYEEEQDNEK